MALGGRWIGNGETLQDQCVFTGSVIENIRYGMPHATEEEARVAVSMAEGMLKRVMCHAWTRSWGEREREYACMPRGAYP